ncbi:MULTISPECIES: hypothetical protein [unclassified Pseudomonas]|jgi:hypothetical protein|uniref:hypothetical protein n=1 Tax=unclassified Pseudomonas TaxID=196821 RepID=UPI000C87AA23|nr:MULTISPECIES: hypothetical protein [unclassified Pseudomonas]PMU11825.1 hypothetical protein C1Y11_04640 [Pseudomonas sp. FW305-20]PMU20031.1 hypothetical protein C1Y10_07915 [Pseudomonas sp. FW305-122]PMU43130.1 hypothetical protein C1Y12_02885 [Pseudomonas sp. FW305-47B]PMX64456.1 hypothetical protein C1Y13_03680 [Pseudomonas sp. FW305-33]PMX68788.1 hypothetical protein C1X12_10145 [Pseudomonas sp. FW305-60]
MAIKLYVHGKESFAKKAKPAEEFVIDADFLEVAEAHEQQLDSLLDQFLEQREKEKREKKVKLVKAGREQAVHHS